MTSTAWAEVKALFNAALDLSPANRAAFLEDIGADPDVRAQVLRLLAADELGSGFLTTPAALHLGQQTDPPPRGQLRRGTRLGPYAIAAFLGAGGMGDVYLARDVRVDRYVALKLLPETLVTEPDSLARFAREGRAAAAISHPNICAVHEVGEAAGQPFIAMEHVQGSSLAVSLAARRFSIAEVLAIGVQIAGALAAAHEKGIVHRDLKCANVILTPRGNAKIIDFGIAKRVGVAPGDRPATVLTAHGILVGTISYMSPEQARGEPVDRRSDLFSFGVVLYELATGRRPFTGPNDIGVVDAILHAAPPPMDGVAAAPAAIVLKLLEKAPAARYQSAVDVLDDLRGAAEPLKRGSISG